MAACEVLPAHLFDLQPQPDHDPSFYQDSSFDLPTSSEVFGVFAMPKPLQEHVFDFFGLEHVWPNFCSLDKLMTTGDAPQSMIDHCQTDPSSEEACQDLKQIDETPAKLRAPCEPTSSSPEDAVDTGSELGKRPRCEIDEDGDADASDVPSNMVDDQDLDCVQTLMVQKHKRLREAEELVRLPRHFRQGRSPSSAADHDSQWMRVRAACNRLEARLAQADTYLN
eukprot:CAMPEP_0175969070 /NCGR_PEP_ID=MMETSP0108-20121206/40262_1 /TAXON_ID=195067 ORGANISM="Goniomonas pacifica, Strain CCMP1869" /NCGR_SAMPLE_ID=MMETSP0108 /ASSEMBLY_ACC=CAM_ASM_000204 /LENGTH=223 /DNA_ID=CAMNT_0017297821 /DNA_START=8 /DNA_END=680 /DNA_ORIENTATION=-